jgi:hypothetical protein
MKALVLVLMLVLLTTGCSLHRHHDSTTKAIGPDGGTISIDGAKVTFPAGATARGTVIKLAHQPAPALPGIARGIIRFTGPAVDVVAIQGAIQGGGTVTMTYEPKDVAEGGNYLRVLVDNHHGGFDPLPSTVDTKRHTVTATTPHFSVLGVVDVAKQWVGQAADQFGQQIKNQLVGDENVQDFKCEPGSKTTSISVITGGELLSGDKGNLRACIEAPEGTGNQRVKVFNHYPYPILFKLPKGFTVGINDLLKKDEANYDPLNVIRHLLWMQVGGVVIPGREWAQFTMLASAPAFGQIVGQIDSVTALIDGVTLMAARFGGEAKLSKTQVELLFEKTTYPDGSLRIAFSGRIEYKPLLGSLARDILPAVEELAPVTVILRCAADIGKYVGGKDTSNVPGAIKDIILKCSKLLGEKLGSELLKAVDLVTNTLVTGFGVFRSVYDRVRNGPDGVSAESYLVTLRSDFQSDVLTPVNPLKTVPFSDIAADFGQNRTGGALTGAWQLKGGPLIKLDAGFLPTEDTASWRQSLQQGQVIPAQGLTGGGRVSAPLPGAPSLGDLSLERFVQTGSGYSLGLGSMSGDAVFMAFNPDPTPDLKWRSRFDKGATELAALIDRVTAAASAVVGGEVTHFFRPPDIASGSDISGVNYAYVTTADPDSRVVTFDLVQWFTGAAAAKACAQDGVTGSAEMCSDYYVRNVNQKLRNLPVTPDAKITIAPEGRNVSGTLDQVANQATTTHQNSNLYRLVVRDGKVQELHQVFLP